MEQTPGKYANSDVVRHFFQYIIDVAEKYNENPLLYLRDISNKFYSFTSNELFLASTEEEIDYLWSTKIPLFCSLGSLDGDVLRYLEETVKKDEITEEDTNTFSNIAVIKSIEPASIEDIQRMSRQFLDLMRSHVKGEVSVSTVTGIVDGYYHFIDKRVSSSEFNGEGIISELDKIDIGLFGVEYGNYLDMRQAITEMVKLSLQDQPYGNDALLADQGSNIKLLPAKSEEQAGISSQKSSFGDVIGLETAKDIVSRKLILPAVNPDIGEELGGDTANLLILYGPPGTGKTMFARSLSGELDAIYKEIGTIQEKYVGEAEKVMDRIFSDAKERMKKEGKNIILYFDEITQSFEQERMYDRNLIDKFKSILTNPDELVHVTSKGRKLQIYVIGSTNHLNLLDPVLYRSERGLALEIPLPNENERGLLWQQKLEGKNVEPDIDYKSLARQTNGLSGADIVAIINEQNYVAGLRLESVLGNRRIHECMEELKGLSHDDPRIRITQGIVEKGITVYGKEHGGSSEPGYGIYE